MVWGQSISSHELRNETVEELILIRGGKVVQNWMMIPREREEAAGWGAKKAEDEEKPGKKAMRCHSEQRRCPRRKNPLTVKAGLSRHQPERSSKRCWDTKELDRDVTSGWRTRIASQPLLPAETRVRPLRAGQ